MVKSPRLDGVVAIVTGGGSGIGRACARRLAADGARVAVSDVDAGAAQAVAEELGGPAIAVGCDVRDEAQVADLVARATRDIGAVDALVTSAGIVRFSQTHTTPLDAWQQVIDVNLTGTFLSIKHVIPGMLALGRGSIVTIGSVSAVVAGNTQADPGYKASKGGVLALTRYVAAQYGRAGIRANCLCPGPIAATAIVQAGGADDDAAEHFRKLGAGVPLGRGGDAREIGSVASFLLSQDASFMTGSTVLADGGFTAV
jgi:NAD(P)-dependent dehydrogenase (short-subunit alcohol dehydrogenase family)